MSIDAIAQALADPIRRRILRMLRDRTAMAGAIADAFDVSRPAISRHLRVLREAGLVRDVAQGRERIYQLELGALDALQGYLDELRATAAATWERRLMALETEVHRVRKRSATTRTQRRDETATKKKETA